MDIIREIQIDLSILFFLFKQTLRHPDKPFHASASNDATVGH